MRSRRYRSGSPLRCHRPRSPNRRSRGSVRMPRPCRSKALADSRSAQRACLHVEHCDSASSVLASFSPRGRLFYQANALRHRGAESHLHLTNLLFALAFLSCPNSALTSCYLSSGYNLGIRRPERASPGRLGCWCVPARHVVSARFTPQVVLISETLLRRAHGHSRLSTLPSGCQHPTPAASIAFRKVLWLSRACVLLPAGRSSIRLSLVRSLVRLAPSTALGLICRIDRRRGTMPLKNRCLLRFRTHHLGGNLRADPRYCAFLRLMAATWIDLSRM
jgi:hypothetical protein